MFICGIIAAFCTYYRPVSPQRSDYIIETIPPQESELWVKFIEQYKTYDPREFSEGFSDCIFLKVEWPDVISPTPLNPGFAPGGVLKFHISVTPPDEIYEMEVAIFILDGSNRIRGRYIVRVSTSTYYPGNQKCSFKGRFYFFIPEDMIGDKITLYVEVLNLRSPQYPEHLAIEMHLTRSIEFADRLSNCLALAGLIVNVPLNIIVLIIWPRVKRKITLWRLRKRGHQY